MQKRLIDAEMWILNLGFVDGLKKIASKDCTPEEMMDATNDLYRAYLKLEKMAIDATKKEIR